MKVHSAAQTFIDFVRLKSGLVHNDQDYSREKHTGTRKGCVCSLSYSFVYFS